MRFIAVMLATLLAAPVAAGTWRVCQMEITVQERITQPYARIRAVVGTVRAMQTDAECPSAGEEITFYPETSDYQRILPFKLWPKVGQAAQWRYNYLDGTCKNDGNPAACRIRHHPIGWD